MFKNKWLLLAIASQVVLLVLIIYIPPLEKAFNTYALSPTEWGTALGLTSTIFWIAEIYKLIWRRLNNRKR
jgi:Ca2+-transporting ATPase